MAYITILIGLVIILAMLVYAIVDAFIRVYFINGVEFEDDEFKWRYKYKFVFGEAGVYGLRKVYIFMGTK